MPTLTTDAATESLRVALTELEAVELELARRRRECGMAFYVPNARQHLAHQSEAGTIVYVGGNRSGKSTFGALELCFHLTRQYPDWFAKSRRFMKPIKAVVVVTSFPILERAIEPKLLAYLPKAYIHRVKRTPQNYLQRITCVDGSVVDFLTNEMDDMAFESADWDFYWGDEPQRQGRYYAIRRGLLDRQGLTVLTFTPLVEPWMKDALIDKADNQRLAVFQVTLWDNLQDIKGNPIHTREAIQRFEAEIPEDLRRTRVYGEFFHLRGLVYPEYNSGVHERLFAYAYPDPVVCVLDPHERKPHWAIWAYLLRNDDLYLDSELVVHAPLVELRRRMLLHEATHRYNVRRRLIDPNFGRSPDAPGSAQNVIQALAQRPNSLGFGEANDDVEAGHFSVKDRLYYDPTKSLSVTNKPKLWFHREQCRGTIQSVRNLQYADWVGRTKEDRDVKEAQKQKDTDGADCLRYLCLSHPTYDRLMASRQKYELAEAPY